MGLKNTRLAAASVWLGVVAVGLAGCAATGGAGSDPAPAAATASAASGTARPQASASPGASGNTANPQQGTAPADGGSAKPGATVDSSAGTKTDGSGSGKGNSGKDPSAGGNISDVVPSQTQVTKPPVPAESPASFGSGVSVVLTDSKPTKIEGQGPGESGGDGMVYSLKLKNSGSAKIPLGSVLVTATYGSGLPAELTPRKPTVPFKGSLDSGDSATADYAFVIPKGERDSVVLTVTYAADQPAVTILAG